METIARASDARRPLTHATTPYRRATRIRSWRVPSGTWASAALSTIGDRVPSMSNRIAARAELARSGASASARSAAVTPLVWRARGSRLGLPAMSDPGYAVSSLQEMGDGYGFRKIRHAVGVTAFGINAIVLPPGYESGVHYHDEQEETYFVHAGRVEFRFGEGDGVVLEPGGVARVDAATHRAMKTVGNTDAVIVIPGGKEESFGRDGRAVGGDWRAAGP